MTYSNMGSGSQFIFYNHSLSAPSVRQILSHTSSSHGALLEQHSFQGESAWMYLLYLVYLKDKKGGSK